VVGWLSRIGDDLHGRLAKAGLVEPRHTATLAELLDDFFENRPDVKPGTRVVWKQTADNLREWFGPDCRLADIAREDAEEFRAYLIGRKLAPTTIGKRLKYARQFFNRGIEWGWIQENPFANVRYKAGDPAERRRYVTVQETQRLIDAAPDWVWRTIIALARFGGLRCPSEVLSLQWQDVDLPAGRMVVRSPKTEGRPGGGRRVVPIFARLRPYLEEAWEMAAEGQTHVIPEDRYLPAAHGPAGWINANLRTTFQKILRRAGLEPWPRLFHNLRASCETDLAAEFPIATVCQWIGNTVAIAARHYVQATDADFQRAVSADRQAVRSEANVAQKKSGTESGTVTARNRPQRAEAGQGGGRVKPFGASVCEDMRKNAYQTSRPGGIRTPDPGIMSPLL